MIRCANLSVVAAEGMAVDLDQAIHSRFLFVDVAAMRAKQLRRGAVPRINGTLPHKAERIAMEEVRRGLVAYALPAAMPGPEGRV